MRNPGTVVEAKGNARRSSYDSGAAVLVVLAQPEIAPSCQHHAESFLKIIMTTTICVTTFNTLNVHQVTAYLTSACKGSRIRMYMQVI